MSRKKLSKAASRPARIAAGRLRFSNRTSERRGSLLGRDSKLARESTRTRYLSDSAYWIYLLHLPVGLHWVFLFNYLDRMQTQRTMREIYRVLRPGGRFIFAVPHPSLPFLRPEAPPFSIAQLALVLIPPSGKK